MKEYIKINLQQFAGDEDEYIPDEELPEDEELEDSEVEEETIDESEDGLESDSEDIDEPVKPKKDKKEYAIIKAKQEAKKLKDELAKYRKAEEERLEKENVSKLKQKYLDAGYDEEYANETASTKARQDKLERELKYLKFGRQAERLETKYPDIHEHLDKFIELSEKTGWSLDKICKAELEPSSEFDIRTKAEQQAVLKRKKAVARKPVTGGDTPLETVKLKPQDEEGYQTYLKFNPGVSRKEYKEKILNPNFEEKW